MIILHNSLSKESREFVQNFGDGQIVIDWYLEPHKRGEYLASGYPAPSSFPSLVDAEKRYIFREPQSLADLQDAVDTRTLLSDGAEPPPFSAFAATDIDREVLS